MNVAERVNLAESVQHLNVHEIGLQPSFLLFEIPLDSLADVLKLGVGDGQDMGAEQINDV